MKHEARLSTEKQTQTSDSSLRNVFNVDHDTVHPIILWLCGEASYTCRIGALVSRLNAQKCRASSQISSDRELSGELNPAVSPFKV
jgi:hypothetical protein